MKNFYKILITFLLIFLLGVCISYITIKSTLQKTENEELVEAPLTMKLQKYIHIEQLVY